MANKPNLEQHYLGWDAPVVDIVRDFILRDVNLSLPVDLEQTLIVVPTAQAGRRLRESLALSCEDNGTTLLSAQTVTPAWFLRNSTTPANEATNTLAEAVWAEVLHKADPADCSGFLPTKDVTHDYSWALYTARMLLSLRSQLADAGLRIADVPTVAGDKLQEHDRWLAMAKLEKQYLDLLADKGFSDRNVQEIERASSPELPDSVTRIILAAVPAPTPLMVTALESLASRVPIQVLVHAPQDMQDKFDAWGRPLTSHWCKTEIPIPRFDTDVLLASTPETQAELTLGVMAQNNTLGPADVAIGVPDRTVIPYLESLLYAEGITAFDPAEKPLLEHPLYKLLESFCSLFTNKSYDAFSSLLRHPDLLLYLEEKHEANPKELLTELDNFQNKHLPLDYGDVSRRFTDGTYPGKTEHKRFTVLAKAITCVEEHLASFKDQPPADALRGFLSTVFQVQTVVDQEPEHEELKRVAGIANDMLKELTDASQLLNLDATQSVALLMEALASQTYARERDPSVIDLEGWLELPWNNAPLLIVTGMNEGSVPDTRLSDVFLPNSLREILALRDDAERVARDSYLLSALVASRPENGRAVFIAGKTSDAGDPLKPSRLLFRCPDNDLPKRAERLFGDPGEIQKNYPFSVSFTLDPAPPDDVKPEDLVIDHMSATRFRSYLACPFRFYLGYCLDMDTLDDKKHGLDALDFGSMIHDVMQRLGEDEYLRENTDAPKIAAFLEDRASAWVHARFGKQLPLSVIMLLESAKQRLAAAARVHTGLLEEGWHIFEQPEQAYRIEDFHGLSLVGRIDRIDRHEKTGILRVIDYKTTDAGTLPAKAHVAGDRDDALTLARFTIEKKGKLKAQRWIDLQLPVYQMLVEASGKYNDAEIELAYFNLPKAVGDTNMDVWDGFNEQYMGAARTCAADIVQAVTEHNFWPPAGWLKYDDYEDITFGDINDFITGNGLQKRIEELNTAP